MRQRTETTSEPQPTICYDRVSTVSLSAFVASTGRRDPLHTLVGFFTLLLAFVTVAACDRAAPQRPSSERFEVYPPPTLSLSALQLAPDGRRLAVVAKNQLWVRTFDSVRFEPIADTAGASSPFWWPDGRTLAFFADGALKR